MLNYNSFEAVNETKPVTFDVTAGDLTIETLTSRFTTVINNSGSSRNLIINKRPLDYYHELYLRLKGDHAIFVTFNDTVIDGTPTVGQHNVNQLIFNPVSKSYLPLALDIGS